MCAYKHSTSKQALQNNVLTNPSAKATLSPSPLLFLTPFEPYYKFIITFLITSKPVFGLSTCWFCSGLIMRAFFCAVEQDGRRFGNMVKMELGNEEGLGIQTLHF